MTISVPPEETPRSDLPYVEHASYPPRDATAERPLVTIVLPCFNEQDHVLLEVQRISDAMDAAATPTSCS